MEQRLSMITLGVADLAASVRFYEDVVGWRRYKSGDDEEGIAFFQIGGMVFSLYPLDKLAEDVRVNAEGGGFRGCGLSYNARSEAEVDEIFAALAEKGARIVKAPEKVFWGGYSGYFADPDGHLFEVAYNPSWEIGQDGSVVLPSF